MAFSRKVANIYFALSHLSLPTEAKLNLSGLNGGAFSEMMKSAAFWGQPTNPEVVLDSPLEAKISLNFALV